MNNNTSEYQDDNGEYYVKELRKTEGKINKLIKMKAPKSELQKALKEIKKIETHAEYIPDGNSGFMGDYDNGMYEKYLRRIQYIKNKLKYHLI